MHKNDYTLATGSGEYTNGNPALGIGRSLLGAKWLNAVQRELVALVQQVGIGISDADDSQLTRTVQLHVANVAALKALPVPVPPSGTLVVNVRGYYADGDDGGGDFYWDSSSTAAEDGGTVFVPATAPVSGRWRRQNAKGALSARWFGCKGDDVADDTTALGRLANATSVRIPSGTYVVSDNLTFAGHVTMESGADLSIASGKTVTFGAQWSGTRSQHFSGPGTVVFTRNKNRKVRPEWFGCVPDVSTDLQAAANLSALNKAVAALPQLRLEQGTYWISDTFKIQTSTISIDGVPGIKDAGGVSGGTRILVKSDTADVMQFGPDADPGGGPNSFMQHVYMRNVQVGRDRACASPGESMSGACGIRFKFTLYSFLENVWSTESLLGFQLGGTVQARFTNCFAFRSTAAASGGDFWYGWGIDGYAIPGQLASGNASLYLTNCVAYMGGNVSSIGNAPITSYGMVCDGPCADLYVYGFETSSVRNGVITVGASANAAQRENGHADVFFTNCKFDTMTNAGFHFLNMPTGTSISVQGGYAAPAGVGAWAASTLYSVLDTRVRVNGNIYRLITAGTSAGSGGPSGTTADITDGTCHWAFLRAQTVACITVESCGGNISIDDAFQARCLPEESCSGLLIVSSSGVKASTQIAGSERPVILNAVVASRITPQINTSEDMTLTPAAAVDATACQGCYIAPAIYSTCSTDSKRYTKGVLFNSTGNADNEVNCTLINKAALAGASATNKFRINATDITSTGLNGGSNLTSGVMT